MHYCKKESEREKLAVIRLSLIISDVLAAGVDFILTAGSRPLAASILDEREIR